MTHRPNFAHLALGVFVFGVAAMLALGAWLLPSDKGYSIVGTHAFPLAVSLFMAVIGGGLILQALTGGFRLLEPQAPPENAAPMSTRIVSVAWVSAGLLVDAFLIDHIGFVLASSLLFVAAARGFGSKRWIANLGIGLALSWPVYIGFTQGLGLQLPALIKPWV
jgi:putative tricarboxylic transport membrane protein